MELSIEGFRSFKNIKDINIGKVTVLVGENSAGKTSFLAALRFIHDFIGNPEIASFNREPFLLGAFEQIAHMRGGKSGRVEKFSFNIRKKIIPNAGLMYFRTEENRKYEEEQASLRINFFNEFSIPAACDIEFACEQGRLVVARDSEGSLSITTDSLQKKIEETPYSIVLSDERLRARNMIAMFDELPFVAMNHSSGKNLSKKVLNNLDGFGGRFRTFRSSFRRPIYASAPVRTEPGRAYTPLDANPSPQGSHIPYLLARLKRHDHDRWNALKARIDQFGSTSGMFSKIDVKELGRSESDPFQIYFDLGGPKRNIIDIGYGVSQVLPIITEVMSRDRPTLFLFQQPEVHLHPQAQAALGTFFATEIAQGEHQFVIESHSDFIIDRLRMAVRDGAIAPDKVSILYFQKSRLQSDIHQITIDQDGNINGAPAGYRKFFLDEELRSVGNDYNR